MEIQNVEKGRDGPRIPDEKWLCDVCPTGREYTPAWKQGHLKTKMHRVNKLIIDNGIKGVIDIDVYQIMKKTGASIFRVLIALKSNNSDIDKAIEFLIDEEIDYLYKNYIEDEDEDVGVDVYSDDEDYDSDEYSDEEEDEYSDDEDYDSDEYSDEEEDEYDYRCRFRYRYQYMIDSMMYLMLILMKMKMM